MKMYLDTNPLYELYEILNNEFQYCKRNCKIQGFPFNNLVQPESLITLMLKNNGCPFDKIFGWRVKELKSYPNYRVVFFYGAMGNAKNEFYDYIEVYGTKYLIIFMDFFADIEAEPTPIVGRSTYFAALMKIVEVFLSTTTSMAEIVGALGTTCAAQNYRFAGLFIAAKILLDLVGLNEDDIELMPYDELMKFLKNISIKVLLMGIKFTK